MSIYNYNLAPELTDALKSKFGFEEFYPIQGKVLKPALDGRDIIAKSRTGTGKTLAFVLPLVQQLIANGQRPRRNRCQVIIMEPTRELAKQVASEIEKLTDRFTVGTAYGGAPYQEQERMISAGVDFLIATPGRLLDFLQRGALSLAETKVVVLDESDEMLRRGFQEDIEKVFEAAPDRTQTMLFSATLPPWVKSVAGKYLKEPLLVDTVGSASAAQTSLTVTHKAISAPSDPIERAALIGSLIKTHTLTPNGRVIVFCEKKSDVDALCNGAALGVRAEPLHGDIAQLRRESTMAAFKKGTFRVLVATDVAARGLDIPDVELVIQDFFPKEVETYVHRSGRTGRAGKSGTCIIVHRTEDRPFLRNLAKKINGKIEVIYPPGSDGSSNNDSIISQTVSTMHKHQSTLHRFKEVAERLHADHGNNALAAMLSMVYGAHHTPRSILSSRSGYTAVVLRNSSGFITRRFVNDKLSRMLGTTVETGEYQQYPGGAVVDVSLDTADRIRAMLSSEQGSRFAMELEIPSQLPDALLSVLPQGEYNDGRSYGGRGGSGARGGYQGRGGSTGGYQGRGGSSNFGNRSGGGGSGSGGSYGDRNNSRGGTSGGFGDRRGGSSGYGGGDRSAPRRDRY